MRRHIEDCLLSPSLSVSKNLSADKSFFSAVVFQGTLIRPLRRINEEKAISFCWGSICSYHNHLSQHKLQQLAEQQWSSGAVGKDGQIQHRCSPTRTVHTNLTSWLERQLFFSEVWRVHACTSTDPHRSHYRPDSLIERLQLQNVQMI